MRNYFPFERVSKLFRVNQTKHVNIGNSVSEHGQNSQLRTYLRFKIFLRTCGSFPVLCERKLKYIR